MLCQVSPEETPFRFFENRANLIHLLGHVRLPELSLPARAMVIDGLQRVRLSGTAAENALQNILLKTLGTDLTILKNLCDSKAVSTSHGGTKKVEQSTAIATLLVWLRGRCCSSRALTSPCTV